MSSGALQDSVLSRPSSRGEEGREDDGARDRPRVLPCILTYAGVACLAILALQVLADIWAWPDPVRFWTSATVGGVAAPAGVVAIVRSRWKVCGPEIAIVALTLAGLAIGVQLAALLR